MAETPNKPNKSNKPNDKSQAGGGDVPNEVVKEVASLPPESDIAPRPSPSRPMAQGTPQPTQKNVRPNVILECGNSLNQTITLDTFKQRLRGSWSSAGLMAKRGRALGDKMTQMPDIPGIRIAIYLTLKTVRFYDPLNLPEYKELLVRINSASRNAKVHQSGGQYRGVQDVEKVVTDDVMKTLLLEIVNVHMTKEDPTMRVVNGQLPELDFINKLPGDQLYDPWSNNSLKPDFVKDVPDWKMGNIDREALAAKLG